MCGPQLSVPLTICSARRSGSVHSRPLTSVNSGKCSWLHRVGACRKRIGHHPSRRGLCWGTRGEFSQHVAADNGYSAEIHLLISTILFLPSTVSFSNPSSSHSPSHASSWLPLPTAPFYPLMFVLQVRPLDKLSRTDKSNRTKKLQTMSLWLPGDLKRRFIVGTKILKKCTKARVRHEMFKSDMHLQGGKKLHKILDV